MLLIKIGGGKALNLNGIISDLAGLKEKFIIVHGANSLRDELAEKLGYVKKVVTSLSGYDSVFSTEETIDLAMMAYAGLKNKRIVELCQQNGINAVGLSGLDGKVIQG
ncbi:MAG: acetylglutamate kinase, partial [Melioribacteraceae bacterium]